MYCNESEREGASTGHRLYSRNASTKPNPPNTARWRTTGDASSDNLFRPRSMSSSSSSSLEFIALTTLYTYRYRYTTPSRAPAPSTTRSATFFYKFRGTPV